MAEKPHDLDEFDDTLEVSSPDFSSGSPLDLLMKYKKDKSLLTPAEVEEVEARMKEREMGRAEKEKQRRESRRPFTKDELSAYRVKLRAEGESEEEIENIIDVLLEGH